VTSINTIRHQLWKWVTLQITDLAGALYALRSGDGSQMWSLEAKGSGGFSSPVTVSGMVCVGAGNGVAYALHAGDGTRAWEYAIAGGMDIVPVVGRGVVFVSDGRELIALRVADGRRLWSFPAGAPVLATDVIYTGGRDGRVYALRAGDARRLWRSEPFGTVAIQVVANGRIYVSSDNNANGGYNRMHALRASDGRLLWSFRGLCETPLSLTVRLLPEMLQNGGDTPH
jgi:outer membrane protein assembly factor BamB